MQMENAGQRKAAESCSDDRDRCRHCSFQIGMLFQAPILERRSSHVKLGGVTTRARRSERRTDALSKERIVETAIEILDAEGENALTFRALTTRLATGAGAIYWH